MHLRSLAIAVLCAASAVAQGAELITDSVDAAAVTCEFSIDSDPLVLVPVTGGVCKLDISSISIGTHAARVRISNATDVSAYSNNLSFTRPPVPPVLIGLTLTGSVTPPAPTTIDVGETTITPLGDSGNGNLLLAQRITLTQSATLRSLSFYVTAPAGNLRLGLYADTGSGKPGAKKAETASFAPVAGWNKVDVIAPVALAPANYWLAYFPSHNGLGFRMTNTSVVNSHYVSQAFGTMPTNFPPGTSQTSSHWSFYGTFSVP